MHDGKRLWRLGASIPLPRACEARALPFELNPLDFLAQSLILDIHIRTYNSFPYLPTHAAFLTARQDDNAYSSSTPHNLLQ